MTNVPMDHRCPGRICLHMARPPRMSWVARTRLTCSDAAHGHSSNTDSRGGHYQPFGVRVAINDEMRQLAISSSQENRQQRRLATWAAIIAVPTMIAGVYGMNFDGMPELRWEYGYPAILGAMAAICAALYIGFRRSGWL